MANHHSVALPKGMVRVVTTDRADGDFAVRRAQPGFDQVREAIHTGPWSWLRQVHGDNVIVVDGPGDEAGATGDAVVTSQFDTPIAVTTADCAPVVLIGTTAVGVVHAGWKGLMADVISATALVLDEMGATPLETYLGPCIQPANYEFSTADLDAVAGRFGAQVRSETLGGTPALDMTAAVAAACVEVNWPAPTRPPCTSAPHLFSHRTRGDAGRQTTVAWIEAVR